MKKQADDASQAKIKVRLEILPEKQSFENSTLAREITEDISKHLAQAQYSIKPPYTGKMGGGSEFWVWIVPLIGEKAVEAFTTRVAEKVADLIEVILKKVRDMRYSKLNTNVQVQSLPGCNDINVQGSLENTLVEAVVNLKNIAKHVEETSPLGMTEEVEITISIKFSRDHP
jgi:hypothetical protein